MLIRNTLRYLPAQIIGPTSQFLAILAFTHRMAPEPYGVLTYVFASQDFVFFLCLAWWSQYTVRYFGDHALEDSNRYLKSEGTILTATALAQVAASLFALWLISAPMTLALASATVLYMLTRCFNLHLGERARAQSHFLDYTVAATAGPILGFAAAFLVVTDETATPAAALFAYAGVQVLSLAWLVARQRVQFRLRRPDGDLIRQALTFGLPLIAAGVAAWGGMNSIRVLVDRELGPAAMGLVSVGWSLGQRLTATLAMLMTVAAFPLAVERFRDGARTQAYGELARNGLLMLGIVLPAAVGLYLIERPVIALVVAEPFREMTTAVLPAALVAGVARNLRTHVADQVFILVEKTSVVCGMTIAEAMLVIAGCGLGLRFGGAPGAAIGSAAGYVAAMVLGFVVAGARTGLRLPFGDILLVSLATGAMVLAVLTVGAAIPLPGTPQAAVGVAIIAGVVAYAGALVVLFPALARRIRLGWRRAQPLRSWKKS